MLSEIKKVIEIKKTVNTSMKITFLYYEFEKFSSIIKSACCRITETHPYQEIHGIFHKISADIGYKMHNQPQE